MSEKEDDIDSQPVAITTRPSQLLIKLRLLVLSLPTTAVRLWELFLSISALLSIISSSLLATFNANMTAWLIVVYVTDFIHCFGMCSRLLIGYSENGVPVKKLKRIGVHYLKTTFCVDFVSVIPLEIMALVSTDSSDYYASLLRLNRILRCYQIWKFLSDQEKGLLPFGRLAQGARYFLISGLTVHFQACLWFVIACYNSSHQTGGECRENTWATSPQAVSIDINLTESSVLEQYIISLYWSVATSTTVGYGDIRPVVSLEKFYALLSMIWGVVAFGYILGGVASSITNLDAARGQYVYCLDVIKDYLKNSKISLSLADKVISYYEYLWIYYNGKNDDSFFDELPRSLQTELALELYQNVLQKSFKDAPPNCLRVLSTHLKHSFFLPHQVILDTARPCHCKYFIQKGTIEIVNREDSSVIIELKEGDSFDEEELMSISGTLSSGTTVSVYAKTHCDILSLDKYKLKEILSQFPEVCEKHLISVKEDNNELIHGHSSYSIPQFSLSVSPSRTDTSSQSCSFLKRIKLLWCNTPILPGSHLVIVWNYFLLVTVLFICWLYPFQAGFGFYSPAASYTAKTKGLGVLLYFLTYLFDVIFILDIIISLKKSFLLLDHCYKYETDAKILALTYIKSWSFLFDILSLLPLEILAPLLPNRNEVGLEWGIMLKLNRLLKLWKVGVWFKGLEKSLYYSIAKIRSVKFIIYILLLTHFGACVWFPLACSSRNRCHTDSWATANSINSNTTTLFSDYLISFYWAVTTTTTVGYGDISAVNSTERVIAMIVMLLGVWFYGYVLGSVAAIITHTLLPRVQFHERLHVIHQFMSDNDLNTGLMKRVNDYFWLLWKQYRGAVVPGSHTLLHQLPLSLQQDIKLEECSSLLSEVPFFEAINDDYFMKQICHSTVTYLFSPGDIILYYGDMGRQLYCIKKGNVEVLSEDLSHVVHSVSSGGYFGELGFFFGVPLTATVRASSVCEVFSISYNDLWNIVESFPSFKTQLQDFIDSRHLLDNSMELYTKSNQLTTSTVKPRQFAQPSIVSGLASAMSLPLAIVYNTQHINTVLSSVGSKDIQAQLTPPFLHKPLETLTTVKYSRKNDEERLEGVNQDGKSLQFMNTTISCSSLVNRCDRLELFWKKSNAIFDKLLLCCLLPYRIIPDSKLSISWSILSTLLSAVIAITVPLQAGFLSSFTNGGYYNIPLWLLNYLLDVFFIFDIIVRLHTAYYSSEESQGKLITQPVLCAKNYFKTVFVFDFIAALPTELIALILWSAGLGPFHRLLSLARMNRILRAYKLMILFDYFEDKLPRRSGIVELIKLIVYLILITHIISCIWYMIACSCLNNEYNCCKVGSWFDNVNIDMEPLNNYSVGYHYIASLYWSTATTTTVGYGDISAYNDSERIFALLVMLTGVLFYGVIIANVAASLINADVNRANYQKKLEAVKTYLREQTVCNVLQKRVIDHYEYVWQRTEGLHFTPLFQDMAPALQSDVSLSLYKNAIDQVPLFKNTEIGFTKLLALSIKPTLYLAKEYIVRKGDIGSEMYFINHGTVEVVSEDGKIVFSLLDKGKFFGEISLVFNCLRTATIRASTNCDLFVLTKSDFKSVLAKFPSVIHQIKDAAANRAYLAIMIDQVITDANVEGRSQAEIDSGVSKIIKDITTASRRGSSIWGRRITVFFRRTLFHFSSIREEEQEEQEEDDTNKREDRLCCREHFYTVFWSLLKELLTTTVSPESTFGLVYSYISCLLALISAFTVSYQVFFLNDSIPLTVINYLFEFYFLFEMFVKLHIGYEDIQRHIIVLDFKSVYKHYFKTPSCFALDLFALIPFEIIAVFLPFDGRVRKGAWLYLRLNHVVRVFRIREFFAIQESKLNQKTLLLQVLKFIVLISLSTHFAACIWYVLACQFESCNFNSWANDEGLLVNSTSDGYHYLDSIYWALTTMTTVGYGEISATNLREMIYAIIIMIVGKLLYGFLLGSVVSTLFSMETSYVVVKDKLDNIKDYMNRNAISSTLQNRIIRHLHYNLTRSEGINREDVLNDMPPCLQAEITLSSTERLVKLVPLFAAVDDCLIRQLSIMLKPCLFLPNEYIIHSGDMGHGLYLINHGKVSIHNEEESTTIVLGQGRFFGQECLSSSCEWSRKSVIALTHCDLFSLSVNDFNTLLLFYPNFAQQVSGVSSDDNVVDIVETVPIEFHI